MMRQLSLFWPMLGFIDDFDVGGLLDEATSVFDVTTNDIFDAVLENTNRLAGGWDRTFEIFLSSEIYLLLCQVGIYLMVLSLLAFIIKMGEEGIKQHIDGSRLLWALILIYLFNLPNISDSVSRGELPRLAKLGMDVWVRPTLALDNQILSAGMTLLDVGGLDNQITGLEAFKESVVSSTSSQVFRQKLNGCMTLSEFDAREQCRKGLVEEFEGYVDTLIQSDMRLAAQKLIDDTLPFLLVPIVGAVSGLFSAATIYGVLSFVFIVLHTMSLWGLQAAMLFGLLIMPLSFGLGLMPGGDGLRSVKAWASGAAMLSVTKLFFSIFSIMGGVVALVTDKMPAIFLPAYMGIVVPTLAIAAGRLSADAVAGALVGSISSITGIVGFNAVSLLREKFAKRPKPK